MTRERTPRYRHEPGGPDLDASPAPVAPGGRDVYAAIEAVWRIESARLIARLTRFTGDLALAEDLAHDALEAALRRWPEAGVPDSPAAWLAAVARRRGIDELRHRATVVRTREQLARDLERRQELDQPDLDALADDRVGDDMLRLVFMCCHPVLSLEARVALTLRVVAGLGTPEIARAFLVPQPTVAQRMVRAKRTLAAKRVAFEVPTGTEFERRLASVLQVVYLVFNEGYTATSGQAWLRPELIEEALRLGRILSGLVPGEPEVHGLLALMELQASRTRAREDAAGRPVRLLEQDRGRWDWVLVRRGLAALERAERLGGPRRTYTLQAAIAACHALARMPDETDWQRIVELYDELIRITPSPVVALNRAVAVGMASGPTDALALVDGLRSEPALRSYHLLPAVRGDLLERLGRRPEAGAEFERAASLTDNEAERELLLRRAASTVAAQRGLSG